MEQHSLNQLAERLRIWPQTQVPGEILGATGIEGRAQSAPFLASGD